LNFLPLTMLGGKIVCAAGPYARLDDNLNVRTSVVITR
jgi:hypothetical protein